MDTINEDIALLRAWGAGDREAGAVLFERHVDALGRFFGNKVGEGVDDLIQATFLACLEHPQAFEGRSSFRSYLLSIARYKLYHYYRKSGLHRRAARFNTTSLFHKGPSPSAGVARESEDKNLMRALRTIPLDLQVVLELSFWEDLSGQELAEVLDIPLNTVYTRLHRAKRRLRQALTKLEPNAMG